MRIRSAAVVLEDDHLLVVARVKDGVSYTVLPGGGVEHGESLREACLRELHEETGLNGVVGDLLDVPVRLDAPVFYFDVRVSSRALALGGPERQRETTDNRYEPLWAPLESLGDLPLVPASAAQAVAALIQARG